MKRTTAAIIILIVLLILIGIIYRLSRTDKKSSVHPTVSPVTSITLAPALSQAPASEITGLVKLVSQGQVSAYVPNDQITVLVEASTSSTPVIGYDIVIPYNPEIMAFSSAQSSDDRFTLIANQKNNTLVITGVKKPEQKEKITLSSTVLAKVTFKALRKAHYEMTPLFGLHKTNDTNLMSEKGNDITGKVQGIAINIGTPITVTKDKNVSIDGGLELSLTSTTTIPKNCADCMETTQLEVISGGARQSISYRFGGFAGFHQNSQEAFNTIFVVTKITDGGVSLIYIPKGN